MNRRSKLITENDQSALSLAYDEIYEIRISQRYKL